MLSSSGFSINGLLFKAVRLLTRVGGSLGRLALPCLAVMVSVCCPGIANAQSLAAPFASDFTINSFGDIGTGTVMGFAPGINNKLFVANNGIKVYDYNPATGVSNGQSALASGHNALGLAFHQDPTWGMVMYYGEDVRGANETRNLKLRRVNDSNGNGIFGEASDSLNQIIVDNLKAAGEGGHYLNNLKIAGDSLFLNIGSRTQNGGVDVDGRNDNANGPGSGQARDGLQAGNGYSSGGETSRFGEFQYNGSVTFIRDLTQIGAGDNAAGFAINDTLAAHATDSQFYVTPAEELSGAKDDKLAVYATGFRNVFGMAINDQGELFVAENQNEYPARLTSDRLIKVENFRDDFGYQKSNGWIDALRTPPDLTQPTSPADGNQPSGLDGVNGTAYGATIGTYRDPNGSATAQAAADASYFQQTAAIDSNSDGIIDLNEMQSQSFALIADNGTRNPSITGLDFVPSNVGRQDLAGDIVLATFVHGELKIIDKDTGSVENFVTGFGNGIDVQRDPFGNLLALSVSGNLIQIAPNQFNGGNLKLIVNGDDGQVTIATADGTPVEIRGYSLLSAGSNLNQNGWQSLANNPNFSGWEEANPNATGLSELNPSGSAVITSLEEVSLGNAFSPSAVEFGTPVNPDLSFQYTTADGQVLNGVVELTGLVAVNNLLLTVDPSTGEAELLNSSGTDIQLLGYSILSESGSLKSADGEWSSLEDQSVGDFEQASASATSLSELTRENTSGVLLKGGQSYSLGELFTTLGEDGMEDLELEFLYQELGPAEGDYNDDGVVDAADYTVWRDALGTDTVLPNEGDGVTTGMVTAEDYEVWRTNFGSSGSPIGSPIVFDGIVKYEPLSAASAAASAAGSAVPEPGTLSLILLATVVGLLRRRRKIV